MQSSFSIKSCFRMLFILLLIFPIFSPPMALGDASSIKIGASVSLTGEFAEPSFMVYNAYRLWIDKMNAQGGLLGKKIELIIYDDKSREENCKKIYEKLIKEDKIDFLFPPYGTILTYVATEIAHQYGYVMVVGASTGKRIWERGYNNIFAMYNNVDRYYIYFMDLLARNRRGPLTIIYKKITVFESALNGILKWSKQFGVEVKSIISFDDTADNFPEIVDNLVKENSRVIIWLSYPHDCYDFLNLLNERDYRPDILSCIVTPTFPDFYKKAGKIAEGVMFPSLWEPNERLTFPGSKKFISDFKEFTGVMPSYHAAGSYGACKIIEKAVSETRSLNQETIRKAVMGFKTATVTGPFEVDDQGRQVGHKSLVIQWLRGKKEIVHPRRVKTADPVF